MTKFNYGYIIGIAIGVLFLLISTNTIAAQDQTNTTNTTTDTTVIRQNHTNTTTIVGGLNQFNPVPFTQIPLVVINHTNGQYKFGADFSLDFGGLPVIYHDISATDVPNMQLDKHDTNLALELQCDPNDRCDASLAPDNVRVYLTSISIR